MIRFGLNILSFRLTHKGHTINCKVIDGRQVRALVIMYWLSHHNFREVQYMAGHRYISSAERYVQDDLENLHGIMLKNVIG